MADDQQLNKAETITVQPTEQPTEQPNASQPQSPWLSVAPLVAWWWLALAIATALILGFGFLRAIQLFAKPLGILVLGIAIAAALSPITSWLDRWLPRTVAIISIYLVLLLILVAVGWTAFPAFIDQFQIFADQIPELLNRAQEWFTRRALSGSNPIIGAVTSLPGGVSTWLISLPVTIGDALLQLVLILFISLYALIVAPGAQKFILSLVPEHRRQQTAIVLGDMTNAMGGWVRGTALSSLFIGLFTYIGLLLLGVSYPLPLAVFAAAIEVFPIIGTLISTVVIVAVTFLQSPQLGLFTLIYMLILQQVQGNIIFPNVMSSQADISPLLGLLAFFAGSVVGGLLGAVVAIPLAAALRVLVVELIAPVVRRWTGAKKSPSSEQEHKEIHAAQ